MTRRSFLKRLSVAVAGLAVGAELLTDKCTAKEMPVTPRRPDINPEWVNAQYEVNFILGKDAYERLLPKIETGETWFKSDRGFYVFDGSDFAPYDK